MQSTREQRRNFIKDAKKRWKKGIISKVQFEEIRKDINNLGKEQHIEHTQKNREDRGVKTLSADTEFDLFEELDDNFEPEDINN